MSKRAMSARTQRMLIDADVMTERGLTLSAKPRRCPRCRTACWAGMALVGPSQGVYVNFTPTTQFGELLALSSGIRTYELDGALIVQRCAWSIKHRPKSFIHVQHLCNGPPLPTDQSWKKIFPSNSEIKYPTIPPF